MGLVEQREKYMTYRTRTWLIDDVLNPNSDFWTYDRHDLDNFMTRISPLRTKKMFRMDPEDPVLDQFSEFLNFFEGLSVEEAQDYVEFVEDQSTDMLSDHFWRMVDAQDRRELFNNNINKFDQWFNSLHQTEIEYYMTRVATSKRLVPPSKILAFVKKLAAIKGPRVRSIKSYPLNAGKYLSVHMVGEQLAISSKDMAKLEAVKDILIDRGNIFIEERSKTGPLGETIYTYLFLTKNI